MRRGRETPDIPKIRNIAPGMSTLPGQCLELIPADTLVLNEAAATALAAECSSGLGPEDLAAGTRLQTRKECSHLDASALCCCAFSRDICSGLFGLGKLSIIFAMLKQSRNSRQQPYELFPKFL